MKAASGQEVSGTPTSVVNPIVGGIFSVEETEFISESGTEGRSHIHIRLYRSLIEPPAPNGQTPLAELRNAPLAVWLVILLHADSEGEAYPSTFRLAKLTGYAHSTVQRACRYLQEKGWVERRQVRAENGKWGHAVYRVKARPEPPQHEGSDRGSEMRQRQETVDGNTNAKALASSEEVDSKKGKDIGSAASKRPPTSRILLSEFIETDDLDPSKAEALARFDKLYQQHRGKPHPPVSRHALTEAADSLFYVCGDYHDGDISADQMEEMMRGYFGREYRKGCNYSILHFCNVRIKEFLMHDFAYE